MAIILLHNIEHFNLYNFPEATTDFMKALDKGVWDCLLYTSFSILAYNYQHILPSFISVFSNIFSGTAATGGFLGATVVWAFNRGVNRGLFSNEAGQGSAPIAHAAAKTEEPVSEGMVCLLYTSRCV